ncbi:hypothetical protein V6N13_017848 [Hibiscus sabdariffa]|uniref:Uncharacterized protein n=1 Tax=Hibiscus sabdariffa TaxID=183260 RepID=A0ABR2CH75_9ROSI
MASQLENLVATIKSKVRALKKSKNSNKPYVKMDKSSSVKVEIRSRKARKLIDKTLKAADRPGKPLHSKLRHFVSKPVRVLHKARDFYVESLEDCASEVGDHGGILGCPMAAPQVSRLPKSFNVNYSKSNDDEKFINFLETMLDKRSMESNMQQEEE